jgi:transposase
VTKAKAPAKGKKASQPPKTDAPKSKGGRPSIRTEDIVTSICLRLAQGEPLAQICREDGMPCLVTVWNWQKADPSVSERIARAREAGFDQIAQDALDIADDGSRDYKPSEDGRELPDHDHIQRSKLRVETRLKLLAKWDPKRYGERIAQELTGKDGGPIQTEGVTSPEERQKRIAELAMKLGMKLTPT